MDLRSQLSESQNTFNQSRRLSSAQRYAHSATDRAYRSPLENRLAFESDTDIADRLRGNASRHPSNFSASMRPSPLLLTASQDFSLSANDWTSASRERELEVGDALLSLATDGRQTPSRYVHGLSDDVARPRFRSGDDPLSENLTLLEPGYVEAAPSTSGAYEDLLERTLAASSTGVRRLDEISGDATLDQLLWQDDVRTGDWRAVLNQDDFLSPAGGGRSSEDNLSSGSRLDSTVIDAPPDFAGAERDAGHSGDSLTDTWLNSSSFSASLSFYRDLTEAGGESQNGLATPGESGLDLRLPVPEGSAGNVPEHCYAVPFGRPSPAVDEEMEDGSATASAVWPSPAAGDWSSEPSSNPTSLPSTALHRLPFDDDSRRAPADGESARTAEGRTDDNSSARCRIFPLVGHRAGSASATVTPAVAGGTSLSSFRIGRDARNQGSRPFSDLGCDNCCTARDADLASAGCAACSDANPMRAFGMDDPQPSTSHGPAASDRPRPVRPASQEFQMSTFFQLPDAAPIRPESTGPAGREDARERPSASSTRLLSRPRLFQFTDLFSGPNAPGGNRSRTVPRGVEVYSDELDERTRSADERVSPAWNEPTRRSEPADRRPTQFGGLRFASANERLRECRERINSHVEGLRARFRSSSSTALGYTASGGGSDGHPNDDLYVYRGTGSSGFGSGADPVGEPIGTQAREHMVRRLRMFREEMRSLRQDMFGRSYRHYTPSRSSRSGRDSLFPGEPNIQSLRVNAALNRAISGAFTANGEGSVGGNSGDPTFRIQAWNFTRCEMPNLNDSESNVLVRRAKIHNDANVDISQDGRLICAFTIPARNFGGDIVLSVVSLGSENFGECLFSKNFGQNAISVSLSPCNNYVLVGLATKRFTWMFTPKQIVAQVYQLKTPRAGEDSTELICDITHPCDTDFRAPISMNSARWLLGPGEGLAYGTNRGDLNICRPGFEQIDKPEANDSLSDDVPNRRNLMQMLGITMPRMTNSATQTSHGLRRTAGTQTDQNSQSSSSSLASTSSSAVATLDSGSQAASMDVDDMNLL